jgi:hypothetical protein
VLRSVMIYPRSFPGGGGSEGAFFQVQFNVAPSEVVEGFLQVRHEAAALSGFYHNVIDINLEVAPYLLFEAKLHTLLVCSPHVLQCERHFHVAKNNRKE